MPDENGTLSEEEKKQAIDKIQKLWVGSGKNCPICGSAHWIIADHIVTPTVVGGGGGLLLGGTNYPSVMLISPPCGYTMNFNAIVLGLVQPNKDPAK